MPGTDQPHWPSAPARFIGAAVLGVASVVGAGLSLTRTAVPPGPAGAPQGIDATSVNDSAGGAPPPEAIGRLDLNLATQAELELLPGVGPALAGRIVQDREERGRFESVDDLDRVRGIGPRTLERLRPLLKVGEAGVSR